MITTMMSQLPTEAANTFPPEEEGGKNMNMNFNMHEINNDYDLDDEIDNAINAIEDIQMTKTDNKNIEEYLLNFYCVNIRGLQSKIGSFINVLVEEDVDIGMVCETHCSNDKSIKIPGYVCYYRNSRRYRKIQRRWERCLWAGLSIKEERL